MAALAAAIEKKKRMLFVRETDPQHGGVAMEVHRRDCPEELRHVLEVRVQGKQGTMGGRYRRLHDEV